MFQKVVEDVNTVTLYDLSGLEIEGSQYAVMIDDELYFLVFSERDGALLWRKGKCLFGKGGGSDIGCFENKESAVEYIQGKNNSIYKSGSVMELLEGLFDVLAQREV
jgi:hypothetical protein